MNDASSSIQISAAGSGAQGTPRFHASGSATLATVAHCLDALHAWLDARSPGSHQGFHAALIVDELLHNVAMHGRHTGPGAPSIVRFALWLDALPDGIRIVLHDDGVPFDPLRHVARDTPPTVDSPVGGVGRVLLRRLLQDAQYRFRAGENRLRVWVPAVVRASPSCDLP